MRIAVEGMDGVGKTTIAKKIASELNFVYVSKPLIPLFNTGSTKIDNSYEVVTRKIMDLDDPVVKAWFFGMGNIYSVRNNPKADLVFDRHLVSNYFWNGYDESKIIFKTILEIIGKPDITLLLKASVKERLKRMKQRNQLDHDIFDKEMHVTGHDKMIEFLNNCNMKYFLIDTENKNIDEVCQECAKIINQNR